MSLSRRLLLGVGAEALARPGIVRAQAATTLRFVQVIDRPLQTC